MKRYLNKSLFYQGDGKIFLALTVVYFINYLFTSITLDDYFNYTLLNKLYYDSQNYYTNFNLIYRIENWIMMVSYYAICYLIIVNIFKRKKWSTLLAGPFSRLDIRKRELILMGISFLVYLLTFIIVMVQNIYLNPELVRYVDGFYMSMVLDILRITSISFIGIGIVAILDSFFSNAYYFISSMILLILYCILLASNFNNIIYRFIYSNKYFLGIIDLIRGYFVGEFLEIKKGETVIVYTSLVLILLSIGFIYIAKRLTKHMLVENMNEGIIFELPKKIMKFIMSTFLGIAFSPNITNYLNEMYFNYRLMAKDLIILNMGVIVIISLISFYIIRKIENNKKDVYYKI